MVRNFPRSGERQAIASRQTVGLLGVAVSVMRRMQPGIGPAKERVTLADEAKRRELHQRAGRNVDELGTMRVHRGSEDRAARALGAIADSVTEDRRLQPRGLGHQAGGLVRFML